MQDYRNRQIRVEEQPGIIPAPPSAGGTVRYVMASIVGLSILGLVWALWSLWPLVMIVGRTGLG